MNAPREHERALTVRCGAELHDLAAGQADDDAAELGRGPLLVVRKVAYGDVVDQSHSGLHGCVRDPECRMAPVF